MGLPEIKLSDGRIARFIRKPKAKDASLAHRIDKGRKNGVDMNAVILSQIVEFDGHRLVMEDVLELSLEEFAKLVDIFENNRWGNETAADTALTSEGDAENFTQEQAS